ncbi:hypothetical protein HYV50_05130 [Candidatus Pacearchaeota archaeon]|nr:hypothetical protein [Candidatus Pacearchaeota archaeon]
MGFFDFLKKFQSREETRKEPEKIVFSEINNWLDARANSVFNELNQKLNNFKEQINQEKQNLNEKIKILQEAQIKNPNIPERAKQIMEGNRKIYVNKINSFLSQINFPENSNQIPEFFLVFNNSINELDKNIVKNHHVMEEFFLEKASVIPQGIKKIDYSVKKAKETIEESKINYINKIKAGITNTNNRIREKEKLNEETNFLNNNIKKQIDEIKDNEKNLTELENSEENKNFLNLINEKELLEKEISYAKGKILHSFSEIESAFKKYVKLNQEDKIANSYLTSPLASLIEDKELEIEKIIEKIISLIIENKIELKDKKRDKILNELGRLDNSYFISFLSKYDTLNENINKKNSEIEKLKISEEIASLKNKLQQERINLEKNKIKIEKIEKEISSLNLEFAKSIKNLEAEIKNVFEEEVKIL